MSFFLSSKPPAKSARAKVVVPDKTKAKTGRLPAQRSLAWLWPVLGLLVCAGLCAGWFFGSRALHAQFVARHPAPTGAKAIRMDAFLRAPWVTQKDIADLTEDMGKLLTDDPLDGACLQKVAARLEGHLAVEKVVRVHRDDNGLVQIKAKVYQPAGLVLSGGTLSPVDAQGHLLSAEGLAPELTDAWPLPRIEGVKTPSPYGKDVWKDAGLQAALPLILLLDERERCALRKLSIGGETGGKGPSRITLTLHFQPPAGPPFDVLWGLPIGQEKGVDAPAEDKLKALRGLYTRSEPRSTDTPRFSVRSGSANLISKEDVLPTNPTRPANRPRTP